MINSMLEVKCKCGKVLKVKVNTIDKLQEENKRLKKENKSLEKDNERLRTKVSALELMKESKSSGGGIFEEFSDIFKNIRR